MNDHKVTENLMQRNATTSATLTCSCGLSIDIANLSKTPLKAARAQLAGMHENLKPENSPKPKKEKKSKKHQPVVETEPEKTEEPEPEIDENWQNEGDIDS